MILDVSENYVIPRNASRPVIKENLPGVSNILSVSDNIPAEETETFHFLGVTSNEQNARCGC